MPLQFKPFKEGSNRSKVNQLYLQARIRINRRSKHIRSLQINILLDRRRRFRWSRPDLVLCFSYRNEQPPCDTYPRVKKPYPAFSSY